MNESDFDPKEKPSGYSYRVSTQIWAGEYPVWDWDRNRRIRQNWNYAASSRDA